MSERAYSAWLDEEIEREQEAASRATWEATRAVNEAIRRKVRAYDRLSMLIDARWQDGRTR